MNNAKRMKLLLENYYNAKKEGRKESYDIKNVEDDNYEHYYILFKPLSGIYRDQWHVLEMKTRYGNGSDEVTYPINAPYIRFLTKVYHTNISTVNGGTICLDILKDKTKWMPTYDFSTIIRNITLLFDEPNNASPFNGEASHNYVECEKKYKSLIKKNMSVKEQDELKEKCFLEFKKKADNFATNDLTKYTKWFPQLNSGVVDEEEMQMLEAMMASFKKTVKPDDKPNTSDNTTGSVNTTRWAKYQKKPNV